MAIGRGAEEEKARLEDERVAREKEQLEEERWKEEELVNARNGWREPGNREWSLWV